MNKQSQQGWIEFRAKQKELEFFIKHCMVSSVHYGSVIGDKLSLLKPGAELLRQYFDFDVKISLTESVMDWAGKNTNGEPLFYFRYRCEIYKDGVRVGDCFGSANSQETKYRYRWTDELPAGMDPALATVRCSQSEVFQFQYEQRATSGDYGKPEEYWQQFDQAIQNGTVKIGEKKTRRGMSDTYITEVTKFRIPNPDISEIINTLEKMAQKRAFVGAILVAAGGSRYFTQDLEDVSTLGEVKEWLPTWSEFYKKIIPAVPNLLLICTTETEKVSVISDLFKQKFEVAEWDPHLAAEAYKMFVDLNETENEAKSQD